MIFVHERKHLIHKVVLKAMILGGVFKEKEKKDWSVQASAC